MLRRTMRALTAMALVVWRLPAGPILAQSTRSLSLREAIDQALNNNLDIILGKEKIDEAKGKAAQTRADLLPNVSATASQESVTTNLAALGFEPGIFPGFSTTLLGPFDRFDARFTLMQSVFDLSAIRSYQADRSDVEVSRLREELARTQVITETTLAYLNAISANRAVDAAQANLELARSLLKLANDQHSAGVATGL